MGIPLPQHHTPPPNHVVILPVCSSKLRPLSAIIIIPTTFLGGCGTKEEYACEKMGIDRNSCCEPQDLGHRGPDQSIDFVGDGRLGCELEGMDLGSLGLIWHPGRYFANGSFSSLGSTFQICQWEDSLPDLLHQLLPQSRRKRLHQCSRKRHFST